MAPLSKRPRFRYSLTTLFLVIALCAVCAVAIRWWQRRLTFDTPVRFDDTTTEQQEAVFYLRRRDDFCYDWAVRLAAHDRDIAVSQCSVHGLPVFVARRDGDETAQEWGMPKRLPRTILMHARIHLEKGRHLLPGGKVDPGVPPMDSYQDCYFTRLDRVFAVIWRDEDD
jgi:hypothetical protein